MPWTAWGVSELTPSEIAKSFEGVLDSMSLVLAESSGLQLVETLPAVKSQQIKKHNFHRGIDYSSIGTKEVKPCKTIFLLMIRLLKRRVTYIFITKTVGGINDTAELVAFSIYVG